jgi:hypothetical protein
LRADELSPTAVHGSSTLRRTTRTPDRSSTRRSAPART